MTQPVMHPNSSKHWKTSPEWLVHTLDRTDKKTLAMLQTMGRYQQNGVLWSNEELSKKARKLVRVNTAVKGNMTMMDSASGSTKPSSPIPPWNLGFHESSLWRQCNEHNNVTI